MKKYFFKINFKFLLLDIISTIQCIGITSIGWSTFTRCKLKNSIHLQGKCDHQHSKYCDDCEALKSALTEASNLADVCEIAEKREKDLMIYDVNDASDKIRIWKGHILTVINQEQHKRDILDNLDDQTCLIINDFAMKFLAQKYREAMSDWFGKSGNGMHVMCVLFKSGDKLVKKTYITFIGKSPQGAAAVIAIYQECLQQLRKDYPHLTFVVDKSDNAGCYHNDILIAWKSVWPEANTGHVFVETTFNERQAGKHTCTLPLRRNSINVEIE